MTENNGAQGSQMQALARREEFFAQLAEATGFRLPMVKVAMETVGKGLTPTEFALFLTVAARTGLDPFARQIYAIKRRQRQPDGTYKDVMVLQTGIDGFRAIGARTGGYAGQEGPQWCGKDGQWKDIWLEEGYPAAARVGIYIKGFDRPVWGVAKWREFAPLNEKGQVTGLWAKMPDHMLAKAAEAQAWRKAFPYEMAGVRAEEETTREEAADNGPLALEEAERDRAHLQVPRPASPRFHTRQAAPVVDSETGEVYEDEIPDEEPAEPGRLPL